MKKANLRVVLVTLLLAALGASLPACRPRQTELTFTTIEQEDASRTGKYHESREPAMIIIATPQELTQLDDFVNPEALEHLMEMDYGKYFALAVFQGRKDTGSYGVDIKRIISQDNQITVEVNFQEPLPGFQRTDIVTSPYHLVQVEKPAILEGQLRFLLRAEGNTVATSEAILP